MTEDEQGEAGAVVCRERRALLPCMRFERRRLYPTHLDLWALHLQPERLGRGGLWLVRWQSVHAAVKMIPCWEIRFAYSSIEYSILRIFFMYRWHLCDYKREM